MTVAATFLYLPVAEGFKFKLQNWREETNQLLTEPVFGIY